LNQAGGSRRGRANEPGAKQAGGRIFWRALEPRAVREPWRDDYLDANDSSQFWEEKNLKNGYEWKRPTESRGGSGLVFPRFDGLDFSCFFVSYSQASALQAFKIIAAREELLRSERLSRGYAQMHANQEADAPMALRVFIASIRVHLRVSAAIISCDQSSFVAARGRAAQS